MAHGLRFEREHFPLFLVRGLEKGVTQPVWEIEMCLNCVFKDGLLNLSSCLVFLVSIILYCLCIFNMLNLM
jgi:hypothetical protein